MVSKLNWDMGTVNPNIKAFLKHCQNRNLSPKTIEFYRKKLNRCLPLTQNLLTTKAQVEGWLGQMNTSPGNKMAYLRALRAFYSWAEDTGRIKTNPCHRIHLKVPKPLRYTLKLASIPLLLDNCQSDRDRLIVCLLADTGLRQSEVAGIQAHDVQMDVQIIKVMGKGSKERVVRFGPTTQHYLELAGLPLGLSDRGIATMLLRLGKRTGIHCNAHSFRRLYACESIRGGMNLFHVQSLLGHSNLSMTRLYAEQVNSEDAIKHYRAIIQ
jgi:site-specific recombinase XerD